MPDKEIAGLTAGATPDGGELLHAVQGGNSRRFTAAQFATLAADPATDDGDGLGTASKRWSDLFLASGGVINWAAGDVTLTHAANTLTFAGASSGYVFDAALSIGVNNALTAGTIELGHANDTTLARSAAGVVTIEGVEAVTLSRVQTLTNKTLTDPVITGAILEDIFTITDAAAFEIDPGNGTLQRVTLGANRTPAATNFANGESVTLMVDDGSAFTITWTTVGVVWVGGSAPTLATSGFTIIELWKEGNVIRGAHVGDVAS